MVRERLFIYLVEGFIGLVFTLYALGVLMPVIVLYENVILEYIVPLPVLTAVVFFVGIASFAGIPVLRKSSAKGIKLFVIISVIQIGTIICCFIADSPDVGRSILLMCVSFSIFVLVFLVYCYIKKRRLDI